MAGGTSNHESLRLVYDELLSRRACLALVGLLLLGTGCIAILLAVAGLVTGRLSWLAPGAAVAFGVSLALGSWLSWMRRLERETEALKKRIPLYDARVLALSRGESDGEVRVRLAVGSVVSWQSIAIPRGRTLHRGKRLLVRPRLDRVDVAWDIAWNATSSRAQETREPASW